MLRTEGQRALLRIDCSHRRLADSPLHDKAGFNRENRQRVETELIDPSTLQIVHARLRHAEAFSGFSLCQWPTIHGATQPRQLRLSFYRRLRGPRTRSAG